MNCWPEASDQSLVIARGAMRAVAIQLDGFVAPLLAMTDLLGAPKGGRVSDPPAKSLSGPRAARRPARLLRLSSLCCAIALTARAAPATFATRIAPVLEKNCTVCHGDKKQKAGLRLDSFERMLRGSDDAIVLKPGDLQGSELYRRITLPADDEEVMPSDGKPALSAADIALLGKWIAAGAPATAEFDAPAPVLAAVVPPAAPDYRPRLGAAIELARTLGVRLVPRSRVPTDGLVLRTASAAARCDDAVLAQLAPFADLIVEAELARTKVTDRGLTALGTWTNLVRLDLSHTAVTSAGLAALGPLAKLEAANLTATKVDEVGLAHLRALPALRQVWAFDTAASELTR